MLIPSETVIRHLKSANINVERVLHIGAHDCQEAGFYKELGIKPERTVWIDALDAKVEQAKRRNIPNVYKAVITDTDNADITFNISNNEQSSSVLELGTHKEEHPDIHYIQSIQEKTTALDTFLEREAINPVFEFWNLDIQGAELLALKGGEQALKHVHALYLEVNEKALYKGCPLIGELDAHLLERGFRRVETKMTSHGWGDALYLRTAPRILMLVLANDDGGLYSSLQEITKLYMTSNPQIDCYFIKGREQQEDEFMLEEHSLYIKTQEGYSNDALFKKTMAALSFFKPTIDTYDYVYRTNISTFIRFDIFLEFCRSLPTTNVYCGHKLHDYGIDFVSGTGIIISRDMVKRFIKEPPSFFIQDDLTIGKTMSDWGISIINKPMLGIQPDNLHVTDNTSLQKLQNILDNPGDAYQIRVRTGDAGRLERDLKIHNALYRRFYKPRRVAILYWCLLRTFKEVYESHKKYMYDPLSMEGTVDIYIHSWMPHTESDIPKMPNKVTYRVDNQIPFKERLRNEFHDYFNLETYMDNKGDSRHEWDPWRIRHVIYSTESKKRVTQLLLDSNATYDYCIYIRPDVMVLSPLDTALFERIDDRAICVLNYDHSTNALGKGINDKFAIMQYKNIRPYGFKVDEMKEYRKTVGRLALEHYLWHIVHKHYSNIVYTDFKIKIKL